MKRVILEFINIYRLFSGMFGLRCRFTPSCSLYTSGAVEKYGAAKGLLMGVKRIFRCHPFCEGGFDPVP